MVRVSSSTSPWSDTLSGLNIHRINPFKRRLTDCAGPVEVVTHIVEAYQSLVEKDSRDKRKELDTSSWNPDEKKSCGFHLKIYCFKKERINGVGAFLENVGAGDRDDFEECTHYFVFFLYRAVEGASQASQSLKVRRFWDIYALTMGDGHRVVKPFADFDFPINVAIRVLDSELHVIESKPLAGHKQASTETYRKAYQLEQHELSTIWRVFKVFTTTLREESSICTLKAFDRDKKCQVQVGCGKVHFLRKLPFNAYPRILAIFSAIHRGEETKGKDGKEEVDSKAFKYLRNIRPVDEETSDRLTLLLIEYLRGFLSRDRDDLDLNFVHRYHRDFFRSHSFELIFGDWRTYWYYPPSAFEVASSIREALRYKGVDISSKERLQSVLGRIQFKYSAQPRRFPVLEFFGGEFPDEETGHTHFFNDGIWLRVAASHLEVLQRTFYQLVKPSSGVVIARPEEDKPNPPGWLPYSWTTEARWTAVTMEKAKEEGVDVKELNTALGALQNRTFSFIDSSGKVCVDHVSACILQDVSNSKAVDKKWFELNAFLEENKGKKVSKKDLRAVFPKGKRGRKKDDSDEESKLAGEVYASLQKQRPICASVKVGRSSGTMTINILDADGKVLETDLSSVEFSIAALRHFSKDVQKVLERKQKAGEPVKEKDIVTLLEGKTYDGPKRKVTVHRDNAKGAFAALKKPTKIKCCFKGGLVVQGPVENGIIGVSPETIDYLRQKHVEYCRVTKEEGYNRLYLGVNQFIVCDQVYATKKEQVELFDLLQVDEKTGGLYLYHVKEKFGQPTREACAQIRVAAQALRSDMDGSYETLKRLHANCMKGTDKSTAFRKGVRKQFNDLSPGKPDGSPDGWIDLFKSRQTSREKIVFVYAFIDNGSPERRIEQEQSPGYSFDKDFNAKVRAELKQKGYLDDRCRLTEKFLTENQGQFLKGFDAGCEEEEKIEIFKALEKHANQFNSMGAKVELMHVRDYVERELGFSFQICQINRSGLVTGSAGPAPTFNVGAAPIPVPDSFEYEDETWTLLPNAKTNMEILREILGIKKTYPDHMARFFFQRAFGKEGANIEAARKLLEEDVELEDYKKSLREKPITQNDWEIAAALLDVRLLKFELEEDEEEEPAVKVDKPTFEFNKKGKRTVCLVAVDDELRICRMEGGGELDKMVSKADVDAQLEEWPDPRGISNSGSDCFINAILQVFAHSPLLRIIADKSKLLIADKDLDIRDPNKTEREKKKLREAEVKRRTRMQEKLRAFAKEYHLSSKPCRSPSNTKLRDRLSEMDSTNPDELKQGHRDATNVFNFISGCFNLDGFSSRFSLYAEPNLSEEESQSDPEDWSQYTQINQASQVVLEKDDTYLVTLPIPKEKDVTFQNCLDAFLDCADDKKGRTVNYIKDSRLYRSQASMVREVERFGQRGVFFSYNRFRHEKKKGADGSVDYVLEKISKEVNLPSRSIILDEKEYSLEGFVCHKGAGLQGGHYVAYCLCGDGKWYLFDDAAIPEVKTEAEVLEAVKDAYFLYFAKDSESSSDQSSSSSGEDE